jgi:hypothetical protein
MEAADGNGDQVVDGNGEQVVNETTNNDSCVGDSGANDSQEPYIGMEFESQEKASMEFPSKLVSVHRFLRNLLM